MEVRKSTLYIAFTALCLAALAGLVLHAASGRSNGSRELAERRRLVKELSLTDLVLSTDARYTRHPSMADLNTPFQDSPMSFEHFPSGSLIPPPPHVRTHGSR